MHLEPWWRPIVTRNNSLLGASLHRNHPMMWINCTLDAHVNQQRESVIVLYERDRGGEKGFEELSTYVIVISKMLIKHAFPLLGHVMRP